MKVVTLSNLAESTSQEVFEQVSRHLLTQLKRSTIDGRCKYHLPTMNYSSSGNIGETLKCAAGCLISDEEYQNLKDNGIEIENRNWDDLISKGRIKTENHSHLIQELQDIHDDCSLVPTEDWKPLLINLGKNFTLDTSFIEEEF